MSTVPPTSPSKLPLKPPDVVVEYVSYAITLAITLPAVYYSCMFFYGALREQSRCIATANWPTTDGTVVKSEIVSPPFTRRKNEQALIEFEYSVNGSRHTSQSCRCGHEILTGSKQISATERVIYSHARKATTRWPRGQKVTVAYNPDNHSEAYLDHTQNTFMGVVGVVISSVLYFFLVVTVSLVLMIFVLMFVARAVSGVYNWMAPIPFVVETVTIHTPRIPQTGGEQSIPS